MTLDGRKLAALRKALGLNQGELAARVGIDGSLISKMETGKLKNPTVRTLSKLAEALGVRPDDLLITEDEPQSPEPQPFALSA